MTRSQRERRPAREAAAEAKHRLRIPVLWARLGLPGEPKRSCRSPFREDRKPSFWISFDGMRWGDFGTGERGDAVDFLARAVDCSRREAFRRFLEMAGSSASSLPHHPAIPPTSGEKRAPLSLPPLPAATDADVERVARLRGLSMAGVRLAVARGLLAFGEVWMTPAWLVLDSSRTNAQARRMDGAAWRIRGEKVKACTLPGSRAAWPIGAREGASFGRILLVEGGPDLLAAFHFIAACGRGEDVSAVAMLGAGHFLPVDALPIFAGKRVRIVPHLDAAGMAAAQRWARQLVEARASVDGYNLAGLTCAGGPRLKDLNDAARAFRAEDLSDLCI